MPSKQPTMAAASGILLGFVLMMSANLLEATVLSKCPYHSYFYSYEKSWYGEEVSTQSFRDCPNGCCGTHPDYYCCESYYYYNYYYYYYHELSTGAITGIVLGCLVSFAIITGIIVCSVVMCRNSRLKRRQAANSAGVIYQPSQGVTLAPAANGQSNAWNGITHQPPQVIQHPAQSNLVQAGYVVQYPTHPPTFQQEQTTCVPTAAGNQTSATSSLPVQGSRTTVTAQDEKKSSDPPPMYTN